MHVRGIGIDMAEINRFRKLLKRDHAHFLVQTFSDRERTYCLSYKDSAPHFAGTFAAKEAARKASGAFTFPLREVEIRRTDSGKPELWLKGRRSKSLLISITHDKTSACAIAFNGS